MTPDQITKYKSIQNSLTMALNWIDGAAPILKSTEDSRELYELISGKLQDCKKALNEKVK